MRTIFSSILLAAALALPAGCGSDPEDLEGPGRNAAAFDGLNLRLVTYNTGLAHGAVALADERLPVLPGELEQTGADVLCLNEVWTDEDYESMRAALADAYPYSFRERTTESFWRSIHCLPWTVYRLNSCMEESCTPNGISAEECMRGACKERYDSLSDGCKICLAGNTASPLNCVLWGAKDYAFDGRNGLALFSKLPLEDASYEAYDTKLIKRGVIRAFVNGTRIECTHMSSDLKIVPYPEGGTFSSWQGEMAAQVNQLVPADDRCTVLMGDLNTGPAVGSITAEVPWAYEALRSYGFEEPIASPSCTFCKDNPLAGSPADYWFDHIMLRNCPASSPTYHRVMERPLDVTADGKTLTTRYSDHYGLAADL